ncbi:MAG: RNA 2',3'-cyclic phosphodiesterase [Burkholderiales bacterium]
MASTSSPGVIDSAAGIRTFFALVPSESVRAQFVALARDVARRSRGRSVTGDHVHLTLAFLGDVDPLALPGLRAIGDAMPHVGADVEFTELGAWRASGVAWVTPVAVPASLIALHAKLRAALGAAGYTLDSRAFRPHVTLARRCVMPHPRAHCAPIRWPVDRLCLVGSQLRPEGPLYTELAQWPLAIDG